jgi:hypothetical protein
MAAAAFLTVAATTEHTSHPTPTGLIPLTRNEIAHLVTTLTSNTTRSVSHRLSWSHWRRRHQHRAQRCHYQRQTTQDP